MRLIDVDALCDEIESVEYSGHDPEVERICSLIQKAKWIDAEPVKHGYWEEFTRIVIPQPYNHYEQAWKCSECGYDEGFLEWKYCPHCGAKMEAEHE